MEERGYKVKYNEVMREMMEEYYNNKRVMEHQKKYNKIYREIYKGWKDMREIMEGIKGEKKEYEREIIGAYIKRMSYNKNVSGNQRVYNVYSKDDLVNYKKDKITTIEDKIPNREEEEEE